MADNDVKPNEAEVEQPAERNIDQEAFDFEKHERDSVIAYLEKQAYYQSLAGVVGRIIEECLKTRCIEVHSVQHRAKDPASFGRKASIPSEVDVNRPKYIRPLEQITDLAGVRVITQFHGTLDQVDSLIRHEFRVVERSDKSEALVAEDRFGYQSIHYVVKLRPERAALAEYRRFAESVVEVQIRTILQHAWAEIEHDIQYKSSYTIPAEIRRRFMVLAGILELADREFQAIHETDVELAHKAATRVSKGELTGLEITPGALKLFLDNRLGPDGRMRDWSYDWTARQLKRLGFVDLRQVSTAIAPYHDDQLSRIAEGTRLGQLSRFELMLLAALGANYLDRHELGRHEWFVGRWRNMLNKFTEAGISIGTFNPTTTAEPAD
jgi:putative GTP pyrophosphokinase